MSPNKENLWSAYIDGELSAAEASAFDQSLSPDERARLAAEMQFENKIAEALTSDVSCPDALWKRVEGELSAAKVRSKHFNRRVMLYSSAAVAATLIVSMSYFMSSVQAVPEFMRVATCVDELNQLSEVSSPDGIEDLLHRCGIALDLNMPSPDTWAPVHHVHLLGARHVEYQGSPVVVLMFECCRQPVSVVLAKRKTAAATCIGNAVATGNVQVSRPMGIYVAAVFSNHHDADEALKFVGAKKCHPSTPEE